MTTHDKLRAIRDAIQQDMGGRGLARDPEANLINACPDDFAAACRSIAEHPEPRVGAVTGFWIPSAGKGETDGPLGAVYLWRALSAMGITAVILTDPFCKPPIQAAVRASGVPFGVYPVGTLPVRPHGGGVGATHLIALERVGPSHTPVSIAAHPCATAEAAGVYSAEVPPEAHDRCHSMRGIDITDRMLPAAWMFEPPARPPVTIGIGDGGNEIGMGKVPWEVIRRNIPGGARIACRVPTDHLIVAGVSNWGAYALAAGVALLRGFTPPADWFDLERERAILEAMVAAGLVDGVTGEARPAVDGLAFEEYARPLARIGEIMRA